jgi:chromosome segregation ATPase
MIKQCNGCGSHVKRILSNPKKKIRKRRIWENELSEQVDTEREDIQLEIREYRCKECKTMFTTLEVDEYFIGDIVSIINDKNEQIEELEEELNHFKEDRYDKLAAPESQVEQVNEVCQHLEELIQIIDNSYLQHEDSLQQFNQKLDDLRDFQGLLDNKFLTDN